jgi:hypothetical protein
LKKFSLIVLLLLLVSGLIYLFYGSNSYSFTAEVDGMPVKGLSSFADYSGGRLSIFTMLEDPGKRGIIIFVNASEPGKYLLDSETGPADGKGNYGQYHFGEKNNLIIFLSKGKPAGKCKITTLDLSNKKVSGKFEFEAVEFVHAPTGYAFSTKVVRITNGVFENVPIK